MLGLLIVPFMFTIKGMRRQLCAQVLFTAISGEKKATASPSASTAR